MAKLVAQHYTLQSVHAIVEAKLGVNVALALRMCTQCAQASGGLGVGGNDHAALACSAKVLSRIKAVTSERADGARGAPVPACADRLRGVFNEDQVVAARQARELIHVRRLT